VLTSGSSSYEIEGEIWIKSEGADAAPGPDEGEAANPAEEGGLGVTMRARTPSP
jgi:hypothetical protein